ncbi:hypothetical protein [Rhodococcus ruber]|uniref:hypothetical protein n=1 Tax=Rhodococcus ruber TaxID=1830 RepID=UPI0011AB6881|nr:hypothetical protein [Rhodococcus ruber]
MERVWLSTSYYLDPAVMNLSPQAEVLFLRSIAYSGAAETRGFVPRKVLRNFGISAISRRISELLSAGLWEEIDDDGYLITGWSKWQKNGDALLERRRKDRERQARRRKNVRGQSRDTSRDVTGGEESREEKEGTYVPSSSHQSNARETHTPRPTGPAVDVDGWKLVRDVIPLEHPQATRTALAIEAGTLLKSGSTETDIRTALTLWLTKATLGPRTLPSLVSEVIRSRNQPPRGTPTTATSTTDQRVAQAQALKSQPAIPPPRPLELP